MMLGIERAASARTQALQSTHLWTSPSVLVCHHVKRFADGLWSFSLRCGKQYRLNLKLSWFNDLMRLFLVQQIQLSLFSCWDWEKIKLPIENRGKVFILANSETIKTYRNHFSLIRGKVVSREKQITTEVWYTSEHLCLLVKNTKGSWTHGCPLWLLIQKSSTQMLWAYVFLLWNVHMSTVTGKIVFH